MHEQTDIYFIIIHMRNGLMNKHDPFEKQSHEQKNINRFEKRAHELGSGWQVIQLAPKQWNGWH